MKKTKKQCLAGILSVIMVITAFGIPVYAVGEEAIQESTDLTENVEIDTVQSEENLEESTEKNVESKTEMIEESDSESTLSEETVLENDESIDSQNNNVQQSTEAVVDLEGVITFADVNLKQALLVYDENGDGELSKEELSVATSLDLTYRDIVDLSGLEYAVNTTEIMLQGNSGIRDISPLYSLTNLVRLDLADCDVVNIEGITSLVNLEYIDLRNNINLESASSLYTLTNLQDLTLWNCGLHSVAGIENLTSLRELNIGSNENLKDIYPVYSLTELQSLWANSCNISDLSGIENLVNLMHINVSGHPGLGDISPIFNLQNLQSLYAGTCNISNIQGIERLSNLTEIDLSYNSGLKDIQPLYELDNLWMAYLNNSGIADEEILNFAGYEDKTMTVGSDSLLGRLNLEPSPQVILVDGEDVVSYNGQFVTANKAGTAHFQVNLNNIQRNIVITVIDVPEDVINFTDSSLEKVLKDYDTNRDGVITKGELELVTELDLSNRGIMDLNGLEYAINVTNINLSGNTSLWDIEPIMRLPKLETVSLEGMGVYEYQLYELSGYKDMILNPGEVRQLSKVKVIPSLDVAVCDGENIVAYDETSENIEAIGTGRASIQISHGENFIGEVTIVVRENDRPENAISFEDKKLEEALISYDGDGDGYMTKEEMESIERLSLDGYHITSLDGLEYAVNVVELSLNNNDIQDIQALGSMTKLRELSMWGNRKLKDITPLFGMTKLERVNLYNTAVTNQDIMTLAGYDDMQLPQGSRVKLYKMDVNPSPVLTVNEGEQVISIENLDGGYVVAESEGTASIHVVIGDAEKDIVITVCPVPENAIVFNDPNLKRALSIYDVNNDMSITQEELAAAVKLDLSSSDIIDITGLEYAVNVTEIDLSGNPELMEIGALNSLDKLTRVYLEETNAAPYHVVPLARYKNLIMVPGSEARLYDVEVTPAAEISVTEGEDVISYDSASGMVTAIKTGTARIHIQFSYTEKDVDVLVREENMPEGAIHFNDPCLEMALQEYDINRDGYIMEEELLKATSLTILDSNIKDLTGLRYAKNVTSLSLFSGVSDVSEISHLTNLETLNLSSNERLSNISPIYNLKKLKKLDVYSCRLSNLNGIESLNNLEEIDLGYNNLTDISPLFSIQTLKRVDATECNISDLGGIETLTNLELLNLDRNTAVSDIQSLSGLKNLTLLSLEGCSVDDISSLQGMNKLKSVFLTGNSDLSNIDVLFELPELETAFLYETLVSDVDLVELAGYADIEMMEQEKRGAYSIAVYPMASVNITSGNEVVQCLFENVLTGLAEGEATAHISYGSVEKDIKITVKARPIPEDVIDFKDNNLKEALKSYDINNDDYITKSELAELFYLDISDKDIESLGGLEYAVNLSAIDMFRNNRLTDISPLFGLAGLKHIAAEGCDIQSVAGIQNLTGLERLYLGGNSNLSDISPIFELTKVKELSIPDCSVASISGIEKMEGLLHLTLDRNAQLSDISPLYKMDGLKNVRLEATAVSGEDMIKLARYQNKEMIPGDKGCLYEINVYPLAETLILEENSVIKYADGEIIAERTGTAHIQLTCKESKKTITINVSPIEENPPVAEEKNVDISYPENVNSNQASTAVIIDSEGQLWNIYPELSKVQENVKEYSAEKVCGDDTVYEYVIDNENSLWVGESKRIENVVSVDYPYVLDENNVLHNLYDESAGVVQNVAEYQISRENGMYQPGGTSYVLKTDGTLWAKEPTTRIFTARMMMANEVVSVGWRLIDENVKSISEWYYLKNDGTLLNYQSEQIAENIESLNKVAGGYYDINHNYFNQKNENLGKIEVVDTVNYGPSAYVLTADGRVYQVSELFGEKKLIAENVKCFSHDGNVDWNYQLNDGKYVKMDGTEVTEGVIKNFLITDKAGITSSYELYHNGDFQYDIKKNDVVRLTSAKDMWNGAGRIFALRSDGTIWDVTNEPECIYGNIPVTNISLDRDNITLTGKGTVAVLKFTIYPTDALDKRVTWVSDKPEVAMVNSEGVVTAIAEGTAVITVETKDGGKKASCIVKVNIEKYSVTYNANGGKSAPSSQKKTQGEALKLTSSKPTKAYTLTYNANDGNVSNKTKSISCTFKNWNTKADGKGTSYASGASYTKDAEVTLYAQWTNPKAGALAMPTRSGYTFDGWYTASSGGSKVTSGTTISKNMTLYAHWSKKTASEPQYKDDVEAFVAQLYKVCLSRNPDAGGLKTWTTRLKNKQETGVSAAYGFVFSNEFKAKNLCNEDYVEQLYEAFMGRKADAAGKSTWVNLLESGTTREEVFNGFALSKEFEGLCNQYGIEQGKGIEIPKFGTIPTDSCTICGKEDGVTGFVTRLYQVCLNRKPDAGGLKDWRIRLCEHTSSGREVAYGFIFSQEFINKKYSNADYVEHLYEAFMGRGSDAAGKKMWVDLLNTGWTREQVFDGFVGSQEFTGICNSYGIVRD